MDTFLRVVRANPGGFLIYVGVLGVLVYRLVRMLRRTWAVARTPKDRWATAALAAVLGLAFAGLSTFLFVSVFA